MLTSETSAVPVPPVLTVLSDQAAAAKPVDWLMLSVPAVAPIAVLVAGQLLQSSGGSGHRLGQPVAGLDWQPGRASGHPRLVRVYF